MTGLSFVPARESISRQCRQSVVLVGMMGCGKSSIGKELADRLHLPFVDSDSVIEAKTGRTITEIFDTHGEDWFREREYETIRDLLAGEAIVLGSGGGAFLDARIRACVRQHGVSIWLNAPLAILTERLKQRARRRPLLHGKDVRTVLKDLMEKRNPIYAVADITTASRSVSKHVAVENILTALGDLAEQPLSHPRSLRKTLDNPERVHIALGNRSYDILIGAGLIARIGEYLAPLLDRARICVVVDANVAGFHLASLERALRQSGISALIFPILPGEASKSFLQLQSLLNDLLASGIERGDMVLAFGGGVVGDLAGCAAGLALRGIDFVQIPTTLLAQVDSSVGGKTGINVAAGKNLVGLFHQPRLVIADTELLKSLPPREMASGYAEVVKYALIQDARMFNWLESACRDILAGDPQTLRRAIWASCSAKATIVADDEREAGQRALLNLGHSFGHALEHAAGYDDKLLHGEAVAIGMVLAYGFSCSLGLCPEEDVNLVREHLRKAGLPVSLNDLDFLPDSDTLLASMRRDKKNKGGELTLILARGIGNCFRAEKVEQQAVWAFLQNARQKT